MRLAVKFVYIDVYKRRIFFFRKVRIYKSTRLRIRHKTYWLRVFPIYTMSIFINKQIFIYCAI